MRTSDLQYGYTAFNVNEDRAATEAEIVAVGFPVPEYMDTDSGYCEGYIPVDVEEVLNEEGFIEMTRGDVEFTMDDCDDC